MEAFLTPTKKSMSAKSDSARSVTLAEPLLDPSGKHSYGAEGETLVTPLGRRSFHRGASFSKHDSDDEEANRALLEWSELSIRFGDKVAVDEFTSILDVKREAVSLVVTPTFSLS